MSDSSPSDAGAGGPIASASHRADEAEASKEAEQIGEHEQRRSEADAGIGELNLDVVARYLPENPIHSLRQIQAVYGALSIAGTSLLPGQDEYAPYLTPNKLDLIVNDPEGVVIAVRIDATGEGLSYEGIEMAPLTPDLVPALGFSHYSPGQGADHSLTQMGKLSGGGAGPSKAARYCIDCIARWTNGKGSEPAIGAVASEHTDGEFIDRLAALGTNETIQGRIERDVQRAFEGDEQRRVVATVAVRVGPSTFTEPPVGEIPGWFLAGEIPVFNAGMRARKTDKLTTKNLSKNATAEGEAACMITGKQGRVVGTAQDPLDLFTIQQAEKFENFDRSQAWRSHPISVDAALLIEAGSAFLDACRVRLGGSGVDVYTLPYFVEMNERRARTLYVALSQLRANLQQGNSDDSSHPMIRLQQTVERTGNEADADALRFYAITYLNDNGDVSVFREETTTSIYWPRAIADAHMDVLASSVFGSAGFGRPETWRHIDGDTDHESIVSAVLTGLYARDTLGERPGSDATADDPGEWLTFAMLTGRSIGRQWLLDQYLDRLGDERANDDDNRLSHNHVQTQYSQLLALGRTGLLTEQSGSAERTTRTTTLTANTPMTDGDQPPEANEMTTEQAASESGLVSQIIARLETNGSESETEELAPPPLRVIRDARLGAFLRDRPALHDSPERRSAFLVGVLLGQLSTYQERERDMQRTFAHRYQTESLTLVQLDRLTKELLDKDRAYAAQDQYRSGSCFPGTTDRITDDLTRGPPSEWDLSLSDMRFYVSLGTAYGTSDRYRAFELREEIAERLSTWDGSSSSTSTSTNAEESGQSTSVSERTDGNDPERSQELDDEGEDGGEDEQPSRPEGDRSEGSATADRSTNESH